MKNEKIIYATGTITIKQGTVFGKIGLSGHNQANGATVTAMTTNDSQIAEKVAKMVIELEKNTRIELTTIIEKLERAFLA